MPPQTNTSVDQIFDALNVLGATPEPVGVADLARTLELPTSTAHRLLVTLKDAGFAERDTTGSKYELGVRAHQLVHSLFRQYGLARGAEPFIRRLVEATGETVALDVRVGWYTVRMTGLEGSREIHAAPRIGHTERLGDSVGGHAILAMLDDTQVARYQRWSGGRRRVPAPVRAAREAGYAHAEAGESAELALPVRRGGRPLAALSIEGTGPAVAPEPRASDLKRIRRVVADLEALIEREPELARDPFGHVDPDELELDAPPPAF